MERVAETSLLAFEEVRQNLGERQRKVFIELKRLYSATNTMLSRRVGLPINSITPRVFELRQKGLVVQSHIAPCPITKRMAKWWKVR